MGLVKVINKYFSSYIISDKRRDHYYCKTLSGTVLAAPARKRILNPSSKKKGNRNVIDDGSVISVSKGQCMMIVSRGRIVEVCAEPGIFLYDSLSEPSIFCGDLGDYMNDVLQNMKKSFTFEFEIPGDSHIYYFNTTELDRKRYGTISPILFRKGGQHNGLNQYISCDGTFSYRIVNPILFYENVCGDIESDYDKTGLDEQLTSELLEALQPAFAQISQIWKMPYFSLPEYEDEITKALDEILLEKWSRMRGIELVSFEISGIQEIPEYAMMNQGRDSKQKALTSLIQQSSKQGYLNYDDITHCANAYFLSNEDEIWLHDSLKSRGISIFDDQIKIDEKYEYNDFAQLNYEDIYRKIVDLAPNLEPFVDEVKRIIPPQWREYSQLKDQMKSGNHYARERMIEMIMRIALKEGLYRAEVYDTDIQDTIGDACLGLVTAANRYPLNSNESFHSYASLWILQNISRNQPTRRPLVYYPAHFRDVYFSVYQFLKSDFDETDDKKTTDLKKKLKTQFGLSDEKAGDVIDAMIPFESFEEKYSDFLVDGSAVGNEYEIEENDLPEYPVELISDGSVEKIAMRNAQIEQLETELGLLDERERNIIVYRFGLFNKDEITLAEIGTIYGISRERVRQIEKNAIGKLRKHLNLDDFSDVYF